MTALDDMLAALWGTSSWGGFGSLQQSADALAAVAGEGYPADDPGIDAATLIDEELAAASIADATVTEVEPTRFVIERPGDLSYEVVLGDPSIARDFLAAGIARELVP